MAVSKYFNNVEEKSEQELFESMAIESIQVAGCDIFYIPLENFQLDPILGEATASTFERSFKIEAYIMNGAQFGGDQNFMSKFGFRIDQTAELYISKKRFAELGTGRVRPIEGDLIYIGNGNTEYASFANTFFEINQVWYATPEWQFGKHFLFRIVAQTYTFSYEKIKTGVKSIDAMQITNATDVSYGINQAIDDVKDNLLDFNVNNPFGNI